MDPSLLPESEPIPQKPRRPAYLGWLVGYLVLYGGILLALQLFAYQNLVKSGLPLTVPPTILLVSILFLGGLGIAAGIGLWLAKKWGWWLAAFYFLYAFVRAVIDLVVSAPAGVDAARSWLSAALGIFLCVVVLLYLYSRDILSYFHLEKFPRWISLSILLVAAALLALVL